MARDDSKLTFYTGWDIDQLVVTNDVAVASGDKIVTVIPTPLLGTKPTFSIMFKPTGSNNWYQEGTSSTNTSFLNQFTSYGYLFGNDLHVVSPAGTVRYYIWADKVNN